MTKFIKVGIYSFTDTLCSFLLQMPESRPVYQVNLVGFFIKFFLVFVPP